VEATHPVGAAARRIEKAVMLKLPLSAPRASASSLAAHVSDPGLEVLAHELPVEGLVAGRHRGVGGEDRDVLHGLERLGQAVAMCTRSRARSRVRKAT